MIGTRRRSKDMRWAVVIRDGSFSSLIRLEVMGPS